MSERSADEAGLSTNDRPSQRRRLSGAGSDNDSFGGDHFQAAPAGRQARAFEVTAMQDFDVFASIQEAPALDSRGDDQAAVAAPPCCMDSAEEVEKVAEALKVQMNPAHYKGQGCVPLLAAMFGYSLPQEEPTLENLSAYLFERGLPLRWLKDDASRIAASMRSTLSALRDRLNSMGSTVQHLRSELPELLNRWNHDVTRLYLIVVAQLACHSGDQSLLNDAVVLAKPLEDQPDEVKLQTIMLRRLLQQGSMVTELGLTKVLCRQLVKDLGEGRTFQTHVWEVLHYQKKDPSGCIKEGKALDLETWVYANQVVGDDLEHQLLSKGKRVEECAKYIGMYPPLQLTAAEPSLFSFSGCGSGVVFDVLTEQVHDNGGDLGRELVVAAHHDCSRQGGFQLYPDNMGDFETGTWFDIPTAYDRVLDERGQGFDPFVQRVAWAMGVGRMMTRKDAVINWDGVDYQTLDAVSCMTFFHGLAQTGKSLSVKVANLIYNDNKKLVGQLANNPEEGFPLSNLWDKAIVTSTELDAGFKLPPTTFNAMLSGENVVIQRKQKDSFDVAWRSHLSAAGNTFWGSRSNNNQGQLDRRVLLFDFVETIEEKDRNNNVINEIKDNMLPIIIKGIRAYKSLIAAAKHHTSTGVDVKTYIDSKTKYFIDSIGAAQTATSLREFMDSTAITVHPKARITTKEFSALYQNFCEKKSLRRSPMTEASIQNAFKYAESRKKTLRESNRWGVQFSIEPKNNVGHAAEGDNWYLGIGEAEWVAKSFDSAPQNPFETTAQAVISRELDRRIRESVVAAAAPEVSPFLGS